LPFTTGTDADTDDQLRTRIKNFLAATGLGTATVIKSSLLGATPSDQNATIISDSLVLNNDSTVTVYVDNGNGYEEISNGVGLESIVDSALGGEYLFQLQTGGRQAPVAKPFLQSINSAPFDLIGGDTLAVVVGNTTYQHVFQTTDFVSPGNATAFEVTASINADPLIGFEALTSDNATYVDIRPKTELSNTIHTAIPTTTGRDAALLLDFPASTSETLRLYKNNILLSEGEFASIFSNPQSLWLNTIANGDTLIVEVDGTGPAIYTFYNADFIATGLYNTVSSLNSLASWAQVLTNKLAGITATVSGADIELTSNLGESNTAKVTLLPSLTVPVVTTSGTITVGTNQITGIPSTTGIAIGQTITDSQDGIPFGTTVIGVTATTVTMSNNALITAPTIPLPIETIIFSNVFTSSLITKGMFNSLDLSATGKVADFTLDRNTAQIELAVPLVKGDVLSAGSALTEAFIDSTVFPISSSVVLTAPAHLWISIDTAGKIIPTGVTSNSLLTVTAPLTNIIRYTSNTANAFSNVQLGDYVIVWSAELPVAAQIEGRVRAFTATTLDILITPTEYTALLAALPLNNIVFVNGFVVFRSALAPQKFEIPTGTYTLDQVVEALQPQTKSLVFSVYQEEYLVVTTNTLANNGSLIVVTSDTQGKLLQFTSGSTSNSQDSLIAFRDSQGYTGELPLFIHSTFASGTVAYPPDSYITAVVSSISLAGRDPNELICILHPYGTGSEESSGTEEINDAQPYGECVQESAIIGGTTIDIAEDPFLRRVRSIDRFYIANPLDFGNNDTFTVILDNNVASESFQIPLYRIALVNNGIASNPYTFNAYDYSASPTTNFASTFGPTFDFANYKVLMQAKKVLKPTPANTAILYRATPWGRSGEKITVEYAYPAFPNSALSSTVVVDTTVAITINLASGAAVTTGINSTTAWNVTVQANTPTAGIDQVTYSWAGTYTFTIASSTVTAGSVYSNNGQLFTVNTSISPGTTLSTTGSGGAPLASGTLTFVSGTGPGTIAYSANVFSGIGAAPALTSVISGNYVNISSQTGFNIANTGVFIVSSYVPPTTTSFTVQMPSGVAVAGIGLLTAINSGIIFYASVPASNTANAIILYVNANLSRYVSATLANSGVSNTGAGVVVLSTYEDSGFTYKYIQLLDGINWLYSDNLVGSPQFTLKNPLALPTDYGYSFNNGELIRFIPTTMPQVEAFISTLAVTGYTNVGSAELAERGSELELFTETVGSSGYIQIVGGTGNEYGVPILNSANILDNNYCVVSVDSVAAQGVCSDQWFRLQAAVAQAKLAGFASNTSITIDGNVPLAGESKVTLLGRTLTERYFGEPRNHIRTQGDTFRVEKQGDLVCLSWNPNVGTNPVFVKSSLNFNDTGGGTVSVALVGGGSSDATYTILSGNANFTELSIGDYITIAGFVLPYTANNGSFVVTGVSDNGKTLQVTNSNAVAVGPTVFIAGNFSATSGVSEGDTLFIPSPTSNINSPFYSGVGGPVVFSSPFNPLNQGRFRVIREYNNSVWFENPNAVEEEVTLPYNPVNLNFDNTTVFEVITTNNTLKLEWTGTGTPPTLGNVTMGDIVNLGTDFLAGNRGSFMVSRSSAALQQIVQLTLPPGIAFPISGPGAYFTINGINVSGSVVPYYVWFQTGVNTDPAPLGYTGIQVTISSAYTSVQVAAATEAAIGALALYFTANSLNNVATTTTVGSVEASDPVNVTMPSPFSIFVVQESTKTFIEAINPDAVAQASVTISTSTLTVHRPQIQFSEYEATVVGDVFVSTGSALTIQNAGSWNIIQVLDRDHAIVQGTMANVTDVSLNNNTTAVYVQEGVFYSGYKQVFLSSAQPDALTRDLIVFNTSAQYQKIDSIASVEMTALSKLNFNTNLIEGLDAYRYNTGLLGEANRIIYGDPRDPFTYPGVGAAGTDIFVRAPLVLRVQLTVEIRLLTGAPFNTIAQQVRSNVSSLVNSNPVGQSIGFSSIVGVVSTIPGVLSVAIASPIYYASPTYNDLILVSPNEKTIIIDPTTDIVVLQLGT